MTILPPRVNQPLQALLAPAKNLHEHDIGEGFGSVYLHYALGPRKSTIIYTRALNNSRVVVQCPADRLPLGGLCD